jgi:hypothetical protein
MRTRRLVTPSAFTTASKIWQETHPSSADCLSEAAGWLVSPMPVEWGHKMNSAMPFHLHALHTSRSSSGPGAFQSSRSTISRGPDCGFIDVLAMPRKRLYLRSGSVRSSSQVLESTWPVLEPIYLRSIFAVETRWLVGSAVLSESIGHRRRLRGRRY